MSGLNREQILDVAVDVATEQGLTELTMDRMARLCGTTRSAIAALFGDQAGLISALVDREANSAMAQLLQNLAALPADADVVQTEIGIVQAMIDGAAASPARWRMLLNPADGDPPELHHRIAAGRALARDVVRKILVERCPVVIPDPQLTAHLHELAAEELARLHINEPERYPVARILRQTAALAGSLLSENTALPGQPR
jgi:AcrR family transcriptional regulator